MFSLDDNNYKPKLALGFDPAANPLTKEQIERNEKTRTLIFQIQNLESLQTDRYWRRCDVVQEMPAVPNCRCRPLTSDHTYPGVDMGREEPEADSLFRARVLHAFEAQTNRVKQSPSSYRRARAVILVVSGAQLDQIGGLYELKRRGI